MSLNFREKRQLQKTVAEQQAALRGGELGFREKRQAQKAMREALTKLGASGQGAAATGPSPIDPSKLSPGDPVEWRNENGTIRASYRGALDDGQSAMLVWDGGKSAAAPIGEVFPVEGGPAATGNDSEAALEATSNLSAIRPFLPRDQFKTLVGLIKRGEEKDAYREKVAELKTRIEGMPVTYEQDGKGMDSVAHLHYFTPSGDYYITEKDMKGNGTEQAFGHADAGMGMGELGYINIGELVGAGAELDLYFTPAPLKQVVKGAGGGEGEQESSELTHAGQKIYKAGERWSVQSPENRGTSRVLGDSLHDTLDAAKKEAELIAKQEASRQEMQDEANRAQEEEARRQAERDAEYADIGGPENESAMARGKRINTLSQQVNFRGQTMTRKRMVEKMLAEGRRPESREENRVKPMSRTAYNRASNEEQRAHEKRMQEAGTKAVYALSDDDYETTVSKTEYDYAQHLLSQAQSEQSDTLTAQAARGDFNDLGLPEFINRLKEAYGQDEDLEGAKEAATGYLTANRDELEEAA